MILLVSLAIMFEIVAKDGIGRIGKLHTPHGAVKTPTLLPVVNPRVHKMPIESNRLRAFGAEMLITNSYLIFRDPVLSQKAREEGIHRLLGFDGPIMSDSGAFQMMTYGEVSVTNRQITAFQEDIGVDAGVYLDIPLAKGSQQEFEKALALTLERGDENIACRREGTPLLWVGPVQGGPFPELVAAAAKAMSERQFSIYALGSVVPLLESYEYSIVARMIVAARRNLPFGRPLHLFGAGHPMMFALAVFLGCDLFDSAAYALYAAQDRYLTLHGTQHLKNLHSFPCCCPVCTSESSPQDLLKLPRSERIRCLAEHNLYISFAEIKTIRQSIMDGRLLDLVWSRSTAHPMLARAVRMILSDQDAQIFWEELETRTKRRAMLISSQELANQPVVSRYHRFVGERFFLWNPREVLVVSDNHPVPTYPNQQVVQLSPLFGVIPAELRGMFPIFQHATIGLPYSAKIKAVISEFLEETAKKATLVCGPTISVDLVSDSLPRSDFSLLSGLQELAEERQARALLEYQFGHRIGYRIAEIRVSRSRYGVINRIFQGKSLLAVIRARDFHIIPQRPLAEVLHVIAPFPSLRVVVTAEAEPFALEGNTVFAKFVESMDCGLRAGDEVLVINEEDELLAAGRLELSPREVKTMQRGVAVTPRFGCGRLSCSD